MDAGDVLPDWGAWCPHGCSDDPDWVRDEEEEADRRWKRSHPMPADTLPESGPPRCKLCHFEIALDDIALRHSAEVCVCLRCYGRQVDDERPMPKGLRDQIQSVVNDVKG